MARRRKPGRRGSVDSTTVVGAVAISLLCLVAFVGFGYWKWTTVAPPKLAGDSLCPIEGPRSVTVVMIDSSDTIPEIGRVELERYLAELADDVPEYGLLELRLLEPGALGGQTLFARCNPGDGANLSALTANPEMARRRWADQFKAPLTDALKSGLAPTGADSSPILATLQSIAVERFSGSKSNNMSKQLVVISDMLEHGPDYSHYQSDLSYDYFKSTEAERRFRTDLNGARVTIRYIDRRNRSGDALEHLDFWARWIENNGGVLNQVERVQGIG